MCYALYHCLLAFLLIIEVFLLGWVVYEFLKIKANFLQFKAVILSLMPKMEVDELIDKLVSNEADVNACPVAANIATGASAGEVAQKRERLAAVIAGGQSQRYLGRAISLDQVDKLSESEILKLYARYEMLFGASIVKTLGHAVLTMYSDLAAYYRPKINPASLTSDLESQPLVELGLSAYSGSLYHRFGLFLTPIAVALTTIKHCKFGEDDGDGVIGGDTANSSEDASSQGP
jgi:hypothetical protein